VKLIAFIVAVVLSGWVGAQDGVPFRAKRPAVTGVHGLVTSGHSLASMTGVRIQMEGGNAADAAVAVLGVLTLTEPMMSGPGGNGFMTIYDKASDRTYSLHGTGAAPLAIDPSQVMPEELSRGMKAGVTPGLFGSWIRLLDTFGTMSLGEVLVPAIEYAENGHPVDAFVVRMIERNQELFEKYPTTARVLLPKGRPPEPGELLKFPDLARTFKRLVAADQEALEAGQSRSEALQAAFDLFYRGEIAQEMVRFYEENGGLFTAEDLARYQPILTEPIHTQYRGHDVYTTPSTSRGGLEVVMQLNLIEGYDIGQLGHNTSESLHLVAESIKLAKSDIYHFVADQEFTNMPTAGMISKKYAAARRSAIKSKRAMVYPDHGNPGRQQTASHWKRPPTDLRPQYSEKAYEGSTSSFSIVDEFGNVVVCTPTLGSAWGTGVIVGETGIFFNNGTRIGSTSPYPEDVNYVRAGQIPILNNSPILVMRDGEFHLSLGTPGGETIGQTQFQVLLNILDFGMGIQEAIEVPRISLIAKPNFYKPGAEITMRVEDGIDKKVVRRLKRMGHHPEQTPAISLGNMQGILRNPKTDTMNAGADPRRMMYAIGW
jgi:gamma-glutamyltranspeptidase/glutathione hydrolase